MANLGMGEILVIALVAMLVFGPNKLPEIMRNVGKAFRSFQAETNKAASTFRSAIEDSPAAPGVIDVPDPPAGAARPEPTAQAPETTPAKPEPPPIDPALRRLEDT